MSPTQKGLVVGVDGSAGSDAAVRWAARDAALRGLPLKLLHVVMPTPADSTMGPAPGTNQWQQDQARHIVDQAAALVEEVSRGQIADLHIEVRYARVVPTLLEAADAARMVVVGRRGVGAPPLFQLGSVSAELLHHAACPVVAVPDHNNHESRVDAPVLVGIDGSPASQLATALAFEEASSRGVAVVALHAWSDVGVFPVVGMDWRTNRDSGQQVLTGQLAEWMAKFPDVPVQQRLVCDVPAQWLTDESRNAQLVVVGRHGRGWHGHVHLGSVADTVARNSLVPVMVVPATASTPSQGGQAVGQALADEKSRR